MICFYVLTPLRQALERINRKAQPLLADPTLLDREDGQDLLDVICMQFLAAGEALKRLEKLEPGLLAARFPGIDWKGAMGFRDVIAHQLLLGFNEITVIDQIPTGARRRALCLPGLMNCIEQVLRGDRLAQQLPLLIGSEISHDP